MEKVLIIKYGELSTKSDNINFFIKQLRNNVASKLKNIKFDIKYDYGRMIIFTESFDEALEKVKEVFGIHEICVGYLLKDRDFDSICDNVLELIKEKEFETFRVTVKRSDKKYPGKSPEIAKNIGGHILKNTLGKKVEIKNVSFKFRKGELLGFSGLMG